MKGKIALILALLAAFLFNWFAVEAPGFARENGRVIPEFLLVDSYSRQILIFVGINIVLAAGFNLVMGYTGQFSLGHAGFMAIGAYASASFSLYVTQGMLNIGSGTTFPAQAMFFVSIMVGGIAAAIAGFAVGVPSLRLRGDYLAIVTLGFGEIIRVVFQNMDAVGGPRGLGGIPKMTDIFWAFACAAITIYVVTALVQSVYGSGFMTTRDDEVAAEAMGVNTTKYKVLAFVLSAFFAGVGGALYAHSVRFISPEGFNFQKSVEIVVMVIFGGLGNVIGVVFAAVFLTYLNEWLREVNEWRMVIYALLLIAIMILRPGGLLGTQAEIRRWMTRLGLRKTTSAAIAGTEAPPGKGEGTP